MADDDEDQDRDRRAKKTNTDLEAKPKDAVRADMAPKGSLGTEPSRTVAPTPTLGLGSTGSQRRTFEAPDQESLEQQQADRDAEIEAKKPLAIKTGDPEIDAQSKAEGFRLVTEAELKESNAEKTLPLEGNEQEKSGAVFAETDDEDVNARYQKTDTMISKSDPAWEKAAQIAGKFQNDKDKEKDRGR